MKLRLKKHLPPALLLLVFLVFTLSFGDTATLLIRIESDTRNMLQIFYGNRAGTWSEQNSIKMNINKGIHTYSFPVKNVLPFSHIRIDLAQGDGNAIAQPITLHNISYSYRFLFKNINFEKLRKSIIIKQGFTSDLSAKKLPATISFTHADPILELQIIKEPLYARIILPLVPILLSYYLIYRVFFRQCFNKYRINLLLLDTSDKASSAFLQELQNLSFCRGLIRTKTVTDKLEIHFNCHAKSLPDIYNTLTNLTARYDITQLHITSRQSGISA